MDDEQLKMALRVERQKYIYRDCALDEIKKERKLQERKYSLKHDAEHSYEEFVALIVHYAGRGVYANSNPPTLPKRHAMVKVAALALAYLEQNRQE